MTMQVQLNTRQLRTRVATAFRRMAQGTRRKSAYASTVAFYRATGHAWTRAFAY
jgi:hypothetical protein